MHGCMSVQKALNREGCAVSLYAAYHSLDRGCIAIRWRPLFNSRHPLPLVVTVFPTAFLTQGTPPSLCFAGFPSANKSLCSLRPSFSCDLIVSSQLSLLCCSILPIVDTSIFKFSGILHSAETTRGGFCFIFQPLSTARITQPGSVMSLSSG